MQDYSCWVHFCQENFEFWAVFWAFLKNKNQRSSFCEYFASLKSTFLQWKWKDNSEERKTCHFFCWTQPLFDRKSFTLGPKVIHFRSQSHSLLKSKSFTLGAKVVWFRCQSQCYEFIRQYIFEVMENTFWKLKAACFGRFWTLLVLQVWLVAASRSS